MSCVYLLRDPVTNLIKIGRATNFEARFANLKTANPRLEEAHRFNTPQAVALEGQLHKRFGIYRQEGEYFDVSIDTVIDYARTTLDRISIFTNPRLGELQTLTTTTPKQSATSDDWDLINQLTEIDSKLAELELEKEILRAKLQLRIDTSDGIENLASWKIRSTMRFNQSLFEADHADLFEKYKQTSVTRALKYHRFL
jgi:hypothetical protein